MANPEIQETLDNFDRLSVCLYRFGISASAILLLLLSVTLMPIDSFNIITPLVPSIRWYQNHYQVFIIITSALSASSLHLYLKSIRWFIGFSAWIGAGMFMIYSNFSVDNWLFVFALGFTYITLSAIAMKESFCFQIRFLKLVPALLAISLLPRLLGFSIFEGGLLLPAAIIYNILSIEKWKMPLGFDIGDRTRYQN